MWNIFQTELHQQMILHERKWPVIHIRVQQKVTADIESGDTIIDQANLSRHRDDEMLFPAQVGI
jgi:hypothetical protein